MTQVYELARQLGWTSAQLMKVLNDRGEYVNSPMNNIEAPVVRAILREFAAEPEVVGTTLADAVLDTALYGDSAGTADETYSSFAADLARIRATPSPAAASSVGNPTRWLPPILRALLDEIIVPDREDNLGPPPDGRPYHRWEMGKAKALQKKWVRQQLLGLSADDDTVIEWIRLTGDGQRPDVATDLATSGITPGEAALRLSYGRPDPRRDNIFSRYRDGRISKTEAIAEVHRWRRNRQVG